MRGRPLSTVTCQNDAARVPCTRRGQRSGWFRVEITVQVEVLRRLTTITGDNPLGVWDARVVDGRGRVLWACDHGHASAAEAVACATARMASLPAVS